MKRPAKDYLVTVEDDGLHAPEVGPWAAEKYRRMGMYAEMFSTGMKNKWPARIYLDLFSGAGHAILKDDRRRIMTSPLLALNVPDRFTKHVFCDQNPACIDALKQRAARFAPDTAMTFINADANESTAEIVKEIPPHSYTSGVLSFCFVDPFGLDIHFNTIKALGTGRAMDFLILLALGMDATRNWKTYVKPGDQKVEKFLGDATWRDRWAKAETEGVSPIRFLALEYAQAMTKLGYLTTSLDQMIEVRTYENNMRLYYLAFFSKAKKGYEFWKEVQTYSTQQLGLGI